MNFPSLARAFAIATDAIARKPKSSCTLFVMCALGFLAYTDNRPVMDTIERLVAIYDRFDVSAKTENERLQDSQVRYERINRAVDRTGGNLNADRVTYWSFSNGSFSTDFEAWNFSNLRYQSVSDGTAPLEADIKRPNTMLAEIQSAIFPTKDSTACKRWNANEFESSYLRASARAVGSDVIFACGVRNIDGHQTARVQASYRNRANTPPDEVVFEQLRLLGVKVEELKHETN